MDDNSPVPVPVPPPNRDEPPHYGNALLFLLVFVVFIGGIAIIWAA